MYLHIGSNVIIKKDSIIGIFNLDKLKENKIFKDFLEKIKKEAEIIDISNKNEKSLILVEEKNIIKAYISNISSITLEKRNII